MLQVDCKTKPTLDGPRAKLSQHGYFDLVFTTKREEGTSTQKERKFNFMIIMPLLLYLAPFVFYLFDKIEVK